MAVLRPPDPIVANGERGSGPFGAGGESGREQMRRDGPTDFCPKTFWLGGIGKELSFFQSICLGTMNTPSALLPAFLIGMASAPAAPDATQTAFFEKNIRPLLAEHCYKCHSADAEKLKGGLKLDTREGWMNGGDSGEVIEPGNPKDSPLMEAVRYGNPDTKMPPKYKLSDKEIEAMHEWITMGAPDPRDEKTAAVAKTSEEKTFDIEEARSFWAFQAPVAVTPPTTTDMSWPQSTIDHFVLAPLEAKSLNPVADADRRTLLRRVHYDLTGLPPSPEELAAFEGDPAPDKDALARVVDRLLASPQFGERWGRHWLDIARYAESMGRTRNYPFPFAWRYRDYVIDAFNADKPYDQFVREQIAGDLIEGGSDPEKNERLVATTFLALGSMDLNEKNSEQYRMDQVDEQIDTTGRAILALTTGCARCHNHKFDPISQKDYYAMAGIFRSTDTLSGYGNRQGGKNSFSSNSLAALHGAVPVATATTPAPPVEQNENRKIKQARQQLNALQEALKLLGKSPKARESASADVRKLAELPREQLATRLRETQQELKRFNKKAGKRGGGGPGLKGDAPFTMAVSDRVEPKDSKLHLRGDIETLGEVVPRGFIEILRRPDTPAIPAKSSGRLEYAEWLTSPANPLAARVMVNRIWQHLLGEGLVRTVDNFGKMGERPSHPELLDYLALRFVENNWSVKAAIREIVLSRTYRLSSTQDAAAFDIDPENRLLWHRNLRRLEVEALRDSMLSASGELDLTRPKNSLVATLGNGEIRNQGGAIEDSVEKNARSVYLPVVRDFVPQMLVAFDFAEPSQVIGQRDVTTVSTQALFLLNNDFVLARSDAAAKRTLALPLPDENARIAFAYEQALGRLPDSPEIAGAAQFLADFSGNSADANPSAWSALYQSLFSSAEFRYVR
jgi:mono/diheme cytochrome c family protein